MINLEMLCGRGEAARPKGAIQVRSTQPLAAQSLLRAASHATGGSRRWMPRHNRLLFTVIGQRFISSRLVPAPDYVVLRSQGGNGCRRIMSMRSTQATTASCMYRQSTSVHLVSACLEFCDGILRAVVPVESQPLLAAHRSAHGLEPRLLRVGRRVRHDVRVLDPERV